MLATALYISLSYIKPHFINKMHQSDPVYCDVVRARILKISSLEIPVMQKHYVFHCLNA